MAQSGIVVLCGKKGLPLGHLDVIPSWGVVGPVATVVNGYIHIGAKTVQHGLCQTVFLKIMLRTNHGQQLNIIQLVGIKDIGRFGIEPVTVFIQV